MAIFAFVFAVSGAVLARTPEAIVNVVDEPAVAASGKTLTAEEVKDAITKAAQTKNWVVTPTVDGKLVASLSWRNNKHTIMVEITCAPNRYSILYKDSINMDYGTWNDEPSIHPYYNRYVKELRDAIRVQMLHL
jgi:hypothetical protein